MKKSLAVTLIAILAIAAIALGALYYTNNDQKTKEIQSLNDDIAGKAGQIETLTADVADKAGQIETLTADAADKANQIETLTADVADKAGQIETLTADVADKAGQIDILTEDAAGKAGQIEKLTSDTADKAKQIETLEADSADKARQIEALEADTADKAKQIEALEADTADKAKQIDTLTADATDKAKQIETLEADAADKAKQIETLEADANEKASKIETLKTDLSDRDSQINTLETTVAEKDKAIASLSTKAEEQAKMLDYANMSEEDLNNVVQQITPPLESKGYSVLIRNFTKAADVPESGKDSVEQQFLSDLSRGLQDRWLLSDNTSSAGMTDQQQIEFYQALVNAELNYLSKYTDLPFTDNTLAEYARTYVSALQDQLTAITEYYGKDDAAYNQLWQDAYSSRTRMIYWINRKYGITLPAANSATLNEMIGNGKYVDHYKTVDAFVRERLEAVDLKVIEQNDYSLTLQFPSIKNDTPYSIESLTVNVLFYDKDNGLIEKGYAYTSSISSGAPINFGTVYISKHFDHIAFDYEFYVSGTVNGNSYYDQYKGTVTPAEQLKWNGAVYKNGELASGQPVFTIENLVQGWDYNTSWGKTLYVPHVTFSVKNTGDKTADNVSIKVVFLNQLTNEVWNEKSEYLIGFSDTPLQPGYSKKAFVYSDVGFEAKHISLPALTAEIYINNTLVQTVDITE